MRKNIYLLIGLLCVSFLAFGKNFSDNILRLGTGGSAVDTEIISNQPGTNDPYQKYDQAQDKWVFSNDGVTEKAIGSGSGGGGGENFNNGFTEDDNANAEDGLTGWTASAGTFAINDSDPLELIQSFEWTPSAQNDTLDSAVLNFDRDIFKGRACEGRIEYIGGDENLTLQVIDADNDVIAEQVLETHNVSGVQSAFFLCPSSGATANDLDLRLRILNEGATASPIIKFDKSYVGTLIGLEVSAEVGTPGQIITTTQDVCPSGTLYADGSAVSRTTYAALYAAVGDRHGEGDGSTTFNLPDYRGRFLRGQDDGAGLDPDAGTRTAMGFNGATGDFIGSVQSDQNDAHNHQITAPVTGDAGGALTAKWNWNTSTNYGNASVTSTSSGGSEARPKNAYVKFCIRTVTVSQQVYKSVPKVAENINQFAAGVNNIGQIGEEIGGVILSASDGGTGILDINFTGLTSPPICAVTVNTGGEAYAVVDLLSNTGVQVRTYNSVGGLTERTIQISCQKTGADFKMPIVQPVVVGGGSTVEIEDDGSSLTTEVKKINFTGAGVTVTEPSTDEIEVNIAGGGGGGGAITSASSGNYNTNSTSYVNIPNLSVNITTGGGAVFVSMAAAAGSTQTGIFGIPGNAPCSVRFVRDGSPLGGYLHTDGSGSGGGTTGGHPLIFFDNAPVAGTYTYTAQLKSGLGSNQCYLYTYSLTAYEI